MLEITSFDWQNKFRAESESLEGIGTRRTTALPDMDRCILAIFFLHNSATACYQDQPGSNSRRRNSRFKVTHLLTWAYWYEERSLSLLVRNQLNKITRIAHGVRSVYSWRFKTFPQGSAYVSITVENAALFATITGTNYWCRDGQLHMCRDCVVPYVMYQVPFPSKIYLVW